MRACRSRHSCDDPTIQFCFRRREISCGQPNLPKLFLITLLIRPIWTNADVDSATGCYFVCPCPTRKKICKHFSFPHNKTKISSSIRWTASHCPISQASLALVGAAHAHPVLGWVCRFALLMHAEGNENTGFSDFCRFHGRLTLNWLTLLIWPDITLCCFSSLVT